MNVNMLIETVRRTVARYRMLTPGDHVVVGVSGGADSVALLHVLIALRPEYGLQLTVVHLDHALRGDASRREADFVTASAHSLGVPCVCEVRDVGLHKRQSGSCLQEAARTVRYRFFDEVRERLGAQRVALGHHADDQAETVLMRLLRGASTRGLGGIPPVRDGVFVRPLIDVPRQAIEQFLAAGRIPFVPDSSAGEQHYLRNKIRHQLLPLLREQYNPRIAEALAATARFAREDESTLLEVAGQAVAGLPGGDGEVRLPVSLPSERPHLAGRLVRQVVERMRGSSRGLAAVHIDAVRELLACRGSGKRVQLPGGLLVWREYDELVFRAPDVAPADFCYRVDTLPAEVALPESGARVSLRLCQVGNLEPLLQARAPRTVYLAADSVALPLTIRSWRPGDRMQPLGFGVEKKVKAFFADERIPLRQRTLIPLVVSGGRIVCVGSLRIAEHCRLHSYTHEALAVTVDGDFTLPLHKTLARDR